MRKAAVLGLLVVLAGCGGEPAKPAAAPPPASSAPASQKPSVAPKPSPSKSTTPASGTCADKYKGQIPRTKLIGTDTGKLCYHPADSGMLEGMLPRLCGTLDLPSDQYILDRLGVHEILQLGNDRGVTGVSHTVTQYSPGGSVNYLADLRNALLTCGPVSRDGWTYSYAEVSGGEALRDDSLLIKQIWHFAEQRDYALQDGSYLISVVRAGDYISVLFDNGWESGETPAATFHDTARTAAGLI